MWEVFHLWVITCTLKLNGLCSIIFPTDIPLCNCIVLEGVLSNSGYNEHPFEVAVAVLWVPL